MKTLDHHGRLIAAGLAAMAGMVDAIGFLCSGGFFLSFMSGNSTRLSVGIAERAGYVGMVAGLLLAFLLGVIFGSSVGRRNTMANGRRQSRLLLVIALLLFVAPICAGYGMLLAALCLAAFCMGVENTLFERDGSVSFGLTYMTGALVKIGQGLATLFNGGEKFAWLPYLQLWLGLVCGAIAGAWLFAENGIYSLWAASILAGFFSLLLGRRSIA